MDGVGGMVPVRMPLEGRAVPLTRESHRLVEGVIAMRARERRWEMERRRLWGDCLMRGEAALVVEFSYGSEERKACGPGDCGVRGGKGASGLVAERVVAGRDEEPTYSDDRGPAELAGRAVSFSLTAGDELREVRKLAREEAERESERAMALLLLCV